MTVADRAIQTPRSTAKLPIMASGWRKGAVVAMVVLSGAAVFFLSKRPASEPMPATIHTPTRPEVAAATGTLVSINALPWARIRITPLGHAASLPSLSEEERTTPCAVALPSGDYLIELENGGLTPPLSERIQAKQGSRNEFVFTMPAYDPEQAAALAGATR